jgi:hypothetical protein
LEERDDIGERTHDVLADTSWRTSSYCPHKECIGLLDLGDEVGIGDLKNPYGPILSVPRMEWAAFIRGAKAGEFDDLIEQ